MEKRGLSKPDISLGQERNGIKKGVIVQSILGRVNTDPQCPIPRSQNHQGGRPDLAQDLDMMLLLRRYSTGLSHSVRLTGTQFTEECWVCASPLYQHLSRPGWHELRPSFWACLNAHHGMHIRIYCRDALLDLSSGKRAHSDCWISGSCSAKRDLLL
jgi:hypothetical protein